jgi:hypothetical protein
MNLIIRAWSWLSSSKNQKTLAFIGGGLAALLTGGWQAYLHISEQPKETIATIEQTTKGDSSQAVISKISLDNKNVVQKTEGKGSPAIISGGDVVIKSEP